MSTTVVLGINMYKFAGSVHSVMFYICSQLKTDPRNHSQCPTSNFSTRTAQRFQIEFMSFVFIRLVLDEPILKLWINFYRESIINRC